MIRSSMNLFLRSTPLLTALPSPRLMPNKDLLGRRLTKIVCTIGPATSSRQMLERLVKAGMDCARLNFSHGSPPEHLEVLRLVRSVSERTRRHIAVLQDLPGPKFRVGTLSGGSLNIKKDSLLSLTTRKIQGTSDLIPLRSGDLPRFVVEGSFIYLSDGSIKLKILEANAREIRCKCETGGILLSGKGVNVPKLKQSFETFTAQDKKYLSFGLEHGVDFVAVSFVRSSNDIESVRRFIKAKGGTTPIVAKIEKREAVENIEKIVKASDAVMVARGDLGVENPIETVPELQKEIISICNDYAVPVITATQMLESMVSNPSPTRAEVTDVANAIFDGTDAVMLSEETAIGKYPVECVKTLHNVALRAEDRLRKNELIFYKESKTFDIAEGMSIAAAEASSRMRGKAILAYLNSSQMLSMISRIRSTTPIIAVSKTESYLRKTKVLWGVFPLKSDPGDEQLGKTINNLVHQRFLRNGDKVLALQDQTGSLGTSEITLTAREITSKQARS
jgi:pyruvate kinase